MKADEKLTFAQPLAESSLLTIPHIRQSRADAAFRLFVFWRNAAAHFDTAWMAWGERLAQYAKTQDVLADFVQNAARPAPAERGPGLKCAGVDELSSNEPMNLAAYAYDALRQARLPATASMVMTRSVTLYDTTRDA